MVEAGSSSQKPAERWWTREIARGRDLVARVRALVFQVLDTMPPVRRSVDELVRGRGHVTPGGVGAVRLIVRRTEPARVTRHG